MGIREGTNQIPAARQLLPRLGLANKIALADAAHTRVEITHKTLFKGGGDHLLTGKDNQKEPAKALETLLAEQSFPPKPMEQTHASTSRLTRLFVPEGFDGVHFGGAAGGVDAEEDANGGGDGEGNDGRPEGDDGFHV